MADKSDLKQELELFRSALSDVTPLPQERADISAPTRAADATVLSYRREKAQEVQELIVDGLSSQQDRLLDPEERVLFALPGVQARLLKRMQAGHLGWDAGIDLHGFSVEAARTELFQFITEALRRGDRSLLVVHGKAYTEPGSPALLKSYVTDWLTQIEGVLAFCSAQAREGGTGALYVLLKRDARTRAR